VEQRSEPAPPASLLTGSAAEQIEKVSAHHGNFWEVLLYGQIGRDRAVMFDLAAAENLQFTATSDPDAAGLDDDEDGAEN
jgi:hypothetical protein